MTNYFCSTLSLLSPCNCFLTGENWQPVMKIGSSLSDISSGRTKARRTRSERTSILHKRRKDVYREAYKSFRHSLEVIGACYDNDIQREFVMIHRRFYRFSLSRDTPRSAILCVSIQFFAVSSLPSRLATNPDDTTLLARNRASYENGEN